MAIGKAKLPIWSQSKSKHASRENFSQAKENWEAKGFIIIRVNKKTLYEWNQSLFWMISNEITGWLPFS